MSFKRVKRAFVQELERCGYEVNGTEKEKEGPSIEGQGMGTTTERNQGVKGALLIVLPRKSEEALAFTDEEAQRSAAFVLRKVIEQQRSNQVPPSRPKKQQRRWKKLDLG